MPAPAPRLYSAPAPGPGPNLYTGPELRVAISAADQADLNDQAAAAEQAQITNDNGTNEQGQDEEMEQGQDEEMEQGQDEAMEPDEEVVEEPFTVKEHFTSECPTSVEYDDTPCSYLSTPDYCSAEFNNKNTGKTLENLLYDARTPNALSEVEQAQLNYNKNIAARQMAEGNFNLDFNANTSKTEYKIPIQKGPYTILPQLAWSVPQPRAPICTTLGQAPLIQPVMTQSKLLLQGLPVDEATKYTGVGSIMPKFQMQEYVTVNSA